MGDRALTGREPPRGGPSARTLLAAPLVLPVLALHAWGRRPLGPGRWDAIVVPGCPVLPDGRPSPALARRVALAVALWREGRAPLVVTTGGPGPRGPAEGVVAAAHARELGVPSSALAVEDVSTTTHDNARCARDLLGPVRVLVATDAYHVLRCERVFARHFPAARGVGAAVGPGGAARMGVRELGSLVVYAARGRL